MRQWWEPDGAAAAVRAHPARVEAAAREVLVAHGVPPGDAVITARQLIEGDLRGYPSHGVDRLRQMTRMLDLGTLRSRPTRTARTTSPASGVVDGDGGLGPPAMAQAVALVRELVATCAVATVGVRAAGHIGILATWAEQIAGDDCLALVVSSSEPGVVLPGGTAQMFGTNPIAFAWLGADGYVTADFSTAALTRSELLKRAVSGQSLPAGTANGPDGRPTTDPQLALLGGLLPFGAGHKGVLLSLLTSVLAGPLVGGPPNHQVTGTRRADAAPNKADFLLAIRLDAMTTPFDFRRQTAEFLKELGTTQSFHTPGSAGHSRRQASSAGIDVSADVARLLWPDGVA